MLLPCRFESLWVPWTQLQVSASIVDLGDVFITQIGWHDLGHQKGGILLCLPFSLHSRSTPVSLLFRNMLKVEPLFHKWWFDSIEIICICQGYFDIQVAWVKLEMLWRSQQRLHSREEMTRHSLSKGLDTFRVRDMPHVSQTSIRRPVTYSGSLLNFTNFTYPGPESAPLHRICFGRCMLQLGGIWRVFVSFGHCWLKKRPTLRFKLGCLRYHCSNRGDMHFTWGKIMRHHMDVCTVMSILCLCLGSWWHDNHGGFRACPIHGRDPRGGQGLRDHWHPLAMCVSALV